ncbi:MAG: energy transducer TonB [Saprospiraceae bacterium]
MFYLKSNFTIAALVLLPCLIFAQGKSVPASYQDKTIYKIVEEAPRFRLDNCEQSNDLIEKQSCSKFALKNYLKDHLQYPKEAKEKKISGIVLVEVIVEPNGKVIFSKILRDIGGGCGQEAIRLINNMPLWVPGKLKGEEVRVQTPLTIKFDL